MIRRLPLIPTIVVLIAAGIMVRLGFWQLDRADEKAALLERYHAAEQLSSEVPFPIDGSGDSALFRRSSIECAEVTQMDARSGTSDTGAKGWAHSASCRLANSDAIAEVVIGWSPNPQPPIWEGGPVQGMIAPGPRLIAMPAQAGLGQIAAPDPNDIPNNHLAYAVQWFLFALVALVIYGLAIRKRLKEQA